MKKTLIDKYIAFPFAINVMKQDRERFKKFTMGPVYLALLNPAIDQATKDFYKLKSDVISNYHLHIKRVGKREYIVDNEKWEYTSEELKRICENIMHEYFGKVEIEKEIIPWYFLEDN